MKERGTITLTLDGVSFEETERFRRVLHTLFEQGVFNIKNGSAKLYFDATGNMRGIDFDIQRWRDNKPDIALAAFNGNVKIESYIPATNGKITI